MADARKHLLPLLQGDEGNSFAFSHNGWDMDTPVCSWDGVTCDSEGSVTQLNLASIKPPLPGTIPSSISRVSSLTQLVLHSNAFTGTIPSEVLSMPILWKVDLSYNKLTGTVPFFESRSIQNINLSHNRFTGDLINVGRGQDSLKLFDIKYNLVSGLLPSIDAPRIEELDLSNNHFRGTIPGYLAEKTTLQRLYLSNNNLSGTIPALGSDASILEEVYLHGNLLSGTLSAELADLAKLKVLFIDNNKITGTVPQELCDRDLNEVFFHGSTSENVDQTYEEIYGKQNGDRGRALQRGEDPASERNGCNSIACPAGYRSKRANNKDGVFPCEECENEYLNPYIGSHQCYDMDQKFILQLFYDATNGDSWTHGAPSWADLSIPACSKEGITCNAMGRVTHIELAEHGLSGTLPPDLGFLSHLEVLDVARNEITGKLPADLRFAPLRVLDISDNKITGNVPMGLCQKAGINGNGMSGIYTCDTIACGTSFYSPTGKADAGAGGVRCVSCGNDDNEIGYLGSTTCSDMSSSSSTRSGITPFGLTGEILLVCLAVCFMIFLGWIWTRSRATQQYITDRAHAQGDPEDDNIDMYRNEGTYGDEMMTGVTAGINVVDSYPADIQIRVKDEWSSGKESTKEVWLDVPKIH